MATAADARPVLILTSDTMWNDVWGTHQYLANSLATVARVLFVEAPVSVVSPLKDRRRLGQLTRRVTPVHDSLAVLAPLAVPPQSHPRLRAPNNAAMVGQIKWALRRLGWGAPDIILCGLTQAWRLGPAFPAAQLAAFLVDAPAGCDPTEDPERMALLDIADVLVATSPVIVAEGEALRLRSILCTQGVDVATIEAAAATGEPPDLAGLGRPRIAYLGTLTTRMDVDAIAALARRRPDWTFVMIGGARVNIVVRSELPELRDIPNICFVGEKHRDELGRYLGACDAAWIPYTHSAFNKASNPLKAMEYLAAGLPVVAPDFDAMHPLAEAGVLTEVADGGDWEQPLADALAAAGDADAVAARLAYARANSWDQRGAELLAALTKAR